MSGNQLFYSIHLDVFAYDLTTRTTSPVFRFKGDDLYYMLGPSDGNEIYYEQVKVGWSKPSIFYIGKYDFSLNRFSTLFSFKEDQLATNQDLPLPTDMTRFRYRNIDAVQNPIFKDWFIFNLSGDNPDVLLEFQTETQEAFASLVFLWNQRTNMFLSLDQILQASGERWSLSDVVWSSDGSKITVMKSNILYILRLDPDTGAIQIETQAAMPQRTYIEAWLGIGDFMIASTTLIENPTIENPPGGYDNILSVGKIIDGVWYEKEFLRLHRTSLHMAVWQLTADDSERHELSCLFDLALPTQLTDSDSAIVLSPLQVMSEPQPDAELLAALAPQTPVMLTGERACADNVRWQKVILSDGRGGWVMEADKAQYYLGTE